MTKKKGLLISRQFGTARAFAAWLKEPTTSAHFSLDVFYYPPGESVLSEVNGAQKIENFLPPKKNYDFVLSGTSTNAVEDSQVFKWARENKIPSIGFVDQWVNYKERFDTSGLPDHIFVLDKRAKEDLLTEVPQLRSIRIAGSPALNYIADYWKTHSRKPQKNVIYFATEPSALPGKDAEQKKIHGFFDLESLQHLIEHIENQQSSQWEVRILLHPSDQLSRVQNHIDINKSYKNLKMEIAVDSKDKAFETAQIIAGMRSFILLESSLLQIPTLSLQIGRKTTSGLTDRPEIKVVTEKNQISLDLLAPAINTGLLGHSWTQNLLQILR